MRMIQSKPPSLTRLHQLDGLRAVACLLVLSTHAFSSTVVGTMRAHGFEYLATLVGWVGQSGVELFFVLSGVVLLRPYVRGVRPFQLASYLRRRAQRLLPPYLVVLLATVPLLVIAGLVPTWYSREILPPFRLGDVFAQLAIVNFGSVTYSASWWSLQVEIVFYALVPLLAWTLARWRLNWLTAALIWIVLAIVAQLERSQVQAARSAELPGTLAFFVMYAPCFFVGTCLAQLDLPRRAGYALLAIGACWVLVVPLALQYTQFPTAYALVYAGVLVLVLQPGAWLGRMLSRPLMVWLGERSYSLFLIHFTTFYATNYVVSLVCPSRSWVYGAVTRALGVPLAFLLAMLLFHFVERRFARGLVSAEYFWPSGYLASCTAAGEAAVLPIGEAVAVRGELVG